ncbi:MAG: hypothetical protein ABSG65_09005 [Bryobacteraceae bacterium]|jgi:hypothetical protein
MASAPQQTLLAAFNQAAGSPSGGQSATAQQGLVDALGQATQVIDAQTQATAANTDALAQGGHSQGSGVGTDVSDVINTASQFLGGGLSLLPLVSLFSGLFGGGQSQQPAPLVPYSMPQSLNLQSSSNGQPVSWGENGLPRSATSGGSSGGSQITVQVQAMDSQSFLDHSDDIAQAVRQSMLNMGSINDVITNL